MSQQGLEWRTQELERLELAITEQEDKILEAVEGRKPDEVIATLKERKLRLMAKEKDLRTQLNELQVRLAAPSGATGAFLSEDREKLDALAAYVDEEKQQKQRAKKRRVSEVGSSDWDILRNVAALDVMDWAEPLVPQQVPSPPPVPFKWQDTPESSQADAYMEYLEQLPYSKTSYMLHNAAKDRQLLSTAGIAPQLGFELAYTSDVALVSKQAGPDMAATGLRVLFELKKKPSKHDNFQAMMTLVLANLHSRKHRPIVVLTDLRSFYKFFWFDESTIFYHTAPDAATAFGLISDHLSEERMNTESSSARAGVVKLTPLASRRQMPILPIEPRGVAMDPRLGEVMSPDELHSYVQRHLLQELCSIPAIAAMGPGPEIWQHMYAEGDAHPHFFCGGWLPKQRSGKEEP